ncbi:hypothetical protein CHB53_01360, partial [Staphylococcus epidermidis]
KKNTNNCSKNTPTPKQYYLTVSPEQVLTEADAIHNALILIGCSIALLIVSLFFRNRLPRIK